jgi:tripartite ATP-independent transporter DctM subunit
VSVETAFEAPAPPPSASPPVRALRLAEEGLACAAVLVMAVLPPAEIALRRAGGFVLPGSVPFVQNLVLWVGLLGGALAARDGRLLAIATATFLPHGRWQRLAGIAGASVGALVAALLCAAAVEFVALEREAAAVIAIGIRTWMAQLVLPVGFGLIAGRLAWRAGSTWRGRLLPAIALGAGAWLATASERLAGEPVWPALLVLVAGALVGAPIFALLGGAAAFLFLSQGITPAVILVETYQLATNPTLPALPLFTLAGFLLAEGHASARLLRVFRASFGWMSGGTAVVCTVLSAFFTTFTGGSGVTILALGGLLYPALRKDGYGDRFSIGLLTAAGSLGLLLPPALPLIIYGIVARTPVEDLFIGGLLPGLLMIAMVAARGIREGAITSAGQSRFSMRELGAASWQAKWELGLPLVVIVSIFGGFATLVQASAIAALYALCTQAFVHRDVSLHGDLRRVLVDAVTTIGGVLLILGVAVGFTNYLVDAQVPERLLDWTRQYIHSPLVFLLALNLFLLVVGCLMDIYSATLVVVPLIVPLGAAFDIHPVHLGIIFVANLELGYLTPPVGLNLFLSSYRFNRPLLEVARASLPMLAILAIAVALITYVPWFTTGLLQMLGR